MRIDEAARANCGVGSFHVHRFHEFEGFRIERRAGREVLVSRCACGDVLDIADAEFAACPDCAGRGPCSRCGGTGRVIHHAALRWRLPEEMEERDADDT